MFKNLYCFVLLAISFCFLGVSAQEGKPVLISGDFRGVNFEEFVKQVEAKTNYHFYFNPAQFDLLVINIEVKDKSVEEILSEVFRNSDYNFSIDEQKIFLVKGPALKTTLPLSIASKLKDSAYWKQLASPTAELLIH